MLRFFFLSFLGILLSTADGAATAPAAATTAALYGECIPTDTNHSQFHCWTSRAKQKDGVAGVPCENNHKSCQEWAERGECRQNPQYMQVSCAKACGTCVNLHVGTTQIAPNVDTRQKVMDRLFDSQRHVYAEAKRDVKNLDKCQNLHERCTFWAVHGECESNPGFMVQNCAPACQSCDKLDLS